MRARHRGRRARGRRQRADGRHRLGDGQHQHPRLRRAAARTAPDHDARLDDAVRRILRVKFRAGLFEHPYVDQAKATDPASFVTAGRPQGGPRRRAGRSMVLLKNNGATLPLDPSKKTAVIGPLGDDQHDMLGPWWGRGRGRATRQRLRRHQGRSRRARRTRPAARSTTTSRPADDPDDCCTADTAAVDQRRANAADQVVLALGETREMSGEAAVALGDRPARRAAGADRRGRRRPASRSRWCSSTVGR